MKRTHGFMSTRTDIAVSIIAVAIVAVWGFYPVEASAQRGTVDPTPSHMTGPMTINPDEGFRLAASHVPGSGSTGAVRRRGAVIIEDMQSTILADIELASGVDSFFDIEYQIDAECREGSLSVYDQSHELVSKMCVLSGVIKVYVYPEVDDKNKLLAPELVTIQAYGPDGKKKPIQPIWKVEKGAKY